MKLGRVFIPCPPPVSSETRVRSGIFGCTYQQVHPPPSASCLLVFFLNSCIYLFMLFGRAGSLLLLRLFLQLWRAWGSSLVAVFRLLLAVPSLVPEQRL